jgi:hypothetical protein
MSAFELATACIAGAVFGFVLFAFEGWRSMGVLLSPAMGAVGGLIGGILGRSWYTNAPVWGPINFHPFDAVFGAMGGLLAVSVVRLFWGSFRPPRHPRPGTR